MQILSVELENVKSYENATVTFSQGVNAIVGHNGAGKSTIVESIGFVLFDTLGYNQSEFIRGGAKSAQASVKFVSNADERAYVVERRIGSGAHYIVSDPDLGARICEGKADVLSFLRHHMQVEPGADLASIFTDAVGVPQGTLTAAFLFNDTNRKKVFEALLRVEEYSRVWDKLREPLSLLKSRKTDIERDIAQLQGRLERLPSLDAEIAERRTVLERTQAGLGKATKELDSVQATRTKLEGVREELLHTERALTQAKSLLHGVAGQHAAAAQQRADAEEAQKLVAKHQAGHDSYLEAQETQKALDQRVRQRQQVDTLRAAVDRQVALGVAKVDTLQQELEKVAEAELIVAELQTAVVEQTRLEGELEGARQQQARLDDAKKLVAQQQEHLTSLHARRADLEQQLTEAVRIEAQIKTMMGQIEGQRAKLDEERAALARMKSQADLIKEQSTRLEDVQTAVCPVCEQPLSALHRQEMLARNTAQLDEMRASYREVSKQVQSLETSLKEDQATLQKWQATLLKLPRADEASKVGEEAVRVQAQLEQAMNQAATLSGAAQLIEATTQALTTLGDPRRRYTVAAEHAKRRKEVEKLLAQARQALTTANDELAKLQAELAEFGDLEAQLDAVEKAMQAHRVAYQTVLSHQRQAAALAEREAELARLAHELKASEAKCQQLEVEHQNAVAKFDLGAYTQAANREQELQREVGNLRGQLQQMEQIQRQAEQQATDLRSLLALVASAEGKKERLADEESVLETIRSLLRQAGPYISAALNRQISDGARQIFSDLMQDYSRHLTWNEDYSISLEVDGRQRTFSQLSGGEQMSAALAVRLALLREMSSIDLAFFDEPTANLDEVRRESLARQILNVRGFQQLVVISHDDTFEQATQNLIRVEREGGISRIVGN